MFQLSSNKGTARFHDDGSDKNSYWCHRKLSASLGFISLFSGKDIDQKQYEIKALLKKDVGA